MGLLHRIPGSFIPEKVRKAGIIAHFGAILVSVAGFSESRMVLVYYCRLFAGSVFKEDAI